MMSRCLFGMPSPICVLLCLCIWCFSELSKSFYFWPFCAALISSVQSHCLCSCLFPHYSAIWLFWFVFKLWDNDISCQCCSQQVKILHVKASFTRSDTEDTHTFLPLPVGHWGRAVSNFVLSSGFYHHTPTSALPMHFSTSLQYGFGILSSWIAFFVLFICYDSYSGLNLAYCLTLHLSETFNY